MYYVDWLLAPSCQQPVNIMHDCTNCCLYRVDPPDDEQQACSKHVEAYYWNKLIENGASCWFMLYGSITKHDQQNIKLLSSLKIKRLRGSCCLSKLSGGKKILTSDGFRNLDRPDRSQSLYLVRSPSSSRPERVMKVKETSDSPSAI